MASARGRCLQFGRALHHARPFAAALSARSDRTGGTCGRNGNRPASMDQRGVFRMLCARVSRLLLPDAPQYTSAPIQRRFLLPFAGILLGLAVCGQLVSSILVVLCGQWGLMLQGVSMAVPSHPVAFVWSWLNLTIWPAWIEEKVFRVRVLGFLTPCGARFCAVYTAALFALLQRVEEETNEGISV